MKVSISEVINACPSDLLSRKDRQVFNAKSAKVLTQRLLTTYQLNLKMLPPLSGKRDCIPTFGDEMGVFALVRYISDQSHVI